MTDVLKSMNEKIAWGKWFNVNDSYLPLTICGWHAVE